VAASFSVFDEDLGELVQSLDYQPVFSEGDKLVLTREERQGRASVD
jgi:hypothetical protein